MAQGSSTPHLCPTPQIVKAAILAALGARWIFKFSAFKPRRFLPSSGQFLPLEGIVGQIRGLEGALLVCQPLPEGSQSPVPTGDITAPPFRQGGKPEGGPQAKKRLLALRLRGLRSLKFLPRAGLLQPGYGQARDLVSGGCPPCLRFSSWGSLPSTERLRPPGLPLQGLSDHLQEELPGRKR